MVFITYIHFNCEGNKTIEINENSTLEFTQKSYERAIDNWFKILRVEPLTIICNGVLLLEK